MALCPKCRKRLAKRACPALGSRLCQLCCGRLRGRDIHCPPACPHLAAHRPYHEKRIIEKKPAGAERRAKKDILGDDRLAWLAFQIEAALARHAEPRPAFTDTEALLALEYAREKTLKGSGRLIIPGESLKPVNEAGESVVQAVETCRYRASAILESGAEGYKKDEKIACLERVALGVRLNLEAHPEGRAYLEDLARRFAQSRAGQRDKKLVTLT
ncbi:MAG: hypothetical protein ACXVJK_02855 [Candidatus Aminicenantales bacterium]